MPSQTQIGSSFMKLITPTFEESAGFPSQSRPNMMIAVSSQNQMIPFSKASVDEHDFRKPLLGDTDRSNFLMMLGSSDTEFQNILHTPMCLSKDRSQMLSSNSLYKRSLSQLMSAKQSAVDSTLKKQLVRSPGEMLQTHDLTQ